MIIWKRDCDRDCDSPSAQLASMHPQLSIEWSICQRDEEVGRLENERNKPGSQLGQSCLAGGCNYNNL
jgi:hypothetical protein